VEKQSLIDAEKRSNKKFNKKEVTESSNTAISPCSLPLSFCSSRLLKFSQRSVLSSSTGQKSKSLSMPKTKEHVDRKHRQMSVSVGNDRRCADHRKSPSPARARSRKKIAGDHTVAISQEMYRAFQNYQHRYRK